jgi:hypothetical protein
VIEPSTAPSHRVGLVEVRRHSAASLWPERSVGLLPDAAVSPTEAAQKLCLQEMGKPIRFITELTVHN